jgi:hypothetical protein
VETVERAFEPYRHLDPIGWIGVFRFLPPAAGVAVAVTGALILLFGGRRLFRLAAGPLGVLVAAVWAGTLAARLGFGAVQRQVTLVSSFALLGAGFLFPPIVIFFAFGVPTGLLAGQLAGPADWLLGFAPGLMVGGAIGVVLQRGVAALLSSALGAWAFVLGIFAALNPFVPAVGNLATSPVPVLSVAGCLTLAGVVYQLFIRPSPEEAEKRQRQRASSKRRDKENAELEKRWSKYGKKA